MILYDNFGIIITEKGRNPNNLITNEIEADIPSYEELEASFNDLFNNPEKLIQMKEKTKILAHKNSTENICNILLGK